MKSTTTAFKTKLNKGLLCFIFSTLILSLSACQGNNESKTAENTDKKSETAQDKSKEEGKKEEEKKKRLIPVEVATTDKGDISAYLLFSTSLETEMEVSVYPQVTGIIKKILVEEGDRVNQNSVLIQLDDEEFAITASESLINYQHQEKEFDRIKEIYERNLVAKSEYDLYQFQKEQAHLRYEADKLTLNRTSIKSPIPGIVTNRHVNLGERVTSSTKLFDVVNFDEMIAYVYVPERYLNDLHVDQQVIIRSAAMGGAPVTGWVKRISPVVDPTSGSFKVTVGLKNTAKMRPGLFVNVEIITETHQNVVLLPKSAIVYEGDDRFVYIVREGAARKIRVNGGLEDSQNVEILDELIANGDKVIIRGQNGLKDNTEVKIMNLQEDDKIKTAEDANNEKATTSNITG